MKAITLKLPDTLNHRLTHFARQRKAGSKSAVVRDAIEAYLNASPRSAEPLSAVPLGDGLLIKIGEGTRATA